MTPKPCRYGHRNRKPDGDCRVCYNQWRKIDYAKTHLGITFKERFKEPARPKTSIGIFKNGKRIIKTEKIEDSLNARFEGGRVAH